MGIEVLKERRQTDKLRLFERLWTLIVVALTTASIALVFELFNLSRNTNNRWQYQWFFADAVSHAIVFFSLSTMMYLWAPHIDSKRYGYSLASVQDDEAREGTAMPDGTWVDEELEEEEDDSLWSIAHGKSMEEAKTNAATPTRVGAAYTEEEDKMGGTLE